MEKEKKVRAVTAFRCELGNALDAEPVSDCHRYRKVIFRKDDQPAREVFYSSDGSERGVILFSYYETGKLKEKETLLASNRSSEKYAYAYNEAGDLTEESHFRNGNLYERKEIIYDDLGRKMEEIHYDENNEAFEKDVFQYNDKGLLVKEQHLNEEGNAEWEKLKEYDEFGRLSQEVENMIKDKEAELTSYIYNESGLKIRTETINLGGELIGSIDISYDEEGRAIRYVSETFGIEPSKMINQVEYDMEGRAIANEYYDVLEGRLVLRETVKYREDGQIGEEEMYELNTDQGNKVTHYRLQLAYDFYLPAEEEVAEDAGQE